MIRIVLDANVLASAVVGLTPATSTPGAILRAWRAHNVEVFSSRQINEEFERTLQDPYFAERFEQDDVQEILALLETPPRRIPLTASVHGVATHPEDDLILATAVSANADYLVTGDKQLQRLGSYQGVTILSPRDFLAMLERRQTGT